MFTFEVVSTKSVKSNRYVRDNDKGIQMQAQSDKKVKNIKTARAKLRKKVMRRVRKRNKKPDRNVFDILPSRQRLPPEWQGPERLLFLLSKKYRIYAISQ